MRCGCRGRRHCGQGCSSTWPSARWERLLPLRPLDSLTFGSPMSVPECTRIAAGNRRAAAWLRARLFGLGSVFRGRLAGLQRLDAALDGRERPAEMGLQLLELLQRVRLRLADDLVRARTRLAQRLLRLAIHP